MSDLPGDMVMEILSRVSLTSLRAVRSTCKTGAGKPFLGFMVIG